MTLSPIFARRLTQAHAPPRTPTNADRIRAYRALAPIELGNSRPWRWHEGREYERQEMLDGRERYATGDHTP